ncbi:hypothetical protein JCM10450v2_005250 [Rhodotorula kratochvilovae]
MDALLQPPTELRNLERNRESLSVLVQQHRDLVARLEEVQLQREQGNGRMETSVPLGMGFEAEGVVPDTSRIICAAGIDDLFLDLESDQAQAFVEKRTVILEKKLKALDEPIARLKKEHEMVVKTLRSAFQLSDEETKA